MWQLQFHLVSVAKFGASTERKALNSGPARANDPVLLFNQAVGPTHRAVFDIKVHSVEQHTD